MVPGSARESPLIRLLLGKERDAQESGMPHDRLGRRELILFIEWVDLGAEWDSRSGEDGGGP